MGATAVLSDFLTIFIRSFHADLDHGPSETIFAADSNPASVFYEKLQLFSVFLNYFYFSKEIRFLFSQTEQYSFNKQRRDEMKTKIYDAKTVEGLKKFYEKAKKSGERADILLKIAKKKKKKAFDDKKFAIIALGFLELEQPELFEES